MLGVGGRSGGSAGAILVAGSLLSPTPVSPQVAPVRTLCPDCPSAVEWTVSSSPTGYGGFSTRGEVARLPDGRLVVAPTFDPGQVAVFGEGGDFVAVVGRQGEGPGETEDISYVAPFGADSVLVVPRNRSNPAVLDVRTGTGRTMRLEPAGRLSPWFFQEGDTWRGIFSPAGGPTFHPAGGTYVYLATVEPSGRVELLDPDLLPPRGDEALPGFTGSPASTTAWFIPDHGDPGTIMPLRLRPDSGIVVGDRVRIPTISEALSDRDIGITDARVGPNGLLWLLVSEDRDPRGPLPTPPQDQRALRLWMDRPDVQRSLYRTWLLIVDPNAARPVAMDSLPDGVRPTWVHTRDPGTLELVVYHEAPTGEIRLRLYRPQLVPRPR